MNMAKNAFIDSRNAGIFYYIPKPNGEWGYDVLVLSDGMPDDSQSHLSLWRESTSTKLFNEWSIPEVAREDLKDVYRGIPRGRICKETGGIWQVRVGIEFADIKDWSQIIKHFGFTEGYKAGYVHFFIWDDEGCIEADVMKLRKVGIIW